MKFVAGGVAFEFLQPPGVTVRRCRAIPAAAMPVPEAAVNENGGFVFRENDVRPDEPTPDPSQEGNFSAGPIWHPRPSAFICSSIQSFSNGDPCVQTKAIAEPMHE